VTLQGGGTVTLSIAADLFTLTPHDRNFVLQLVDTLQEYEASLLENVVQDELDLNV